MSGLSVVVVGDSKCGKTQLINRFANGAFDQVNMMMVVNTVVRLPGKASEAGNLTGNKVMVAFVEVDGKFPTGNSTIMVICSLTCEAV